MEEDMQLVLDNPDLDAPNRAKKHHYVPRWLIKRFLPEGEGELYTGDMKTGRTYRKKPEKLFSETNAYAAFRDGKLVAYGEDAYSFLDDISARAVRSVVNVAAQALAGRPLSLPQPNRDYTTRYVLQHMFLSMWYREPRKFDYLYEKEYHNFVDDYAQFKAVITKIALEMPDENANGSFSVGDMDATRMVLLRSPVPLIIGNRPALLRIETRLRKKPVQIGMPVDRHHMLGWAFNGGRREGEVVWCGEMSKRFAVDVNRRISDASDLIAGSDETTVRRLVRAREKPGCDGPAGSDSNAHAEP